MIPLEPILTGASVVGALAVVLTSVVRGHETGWELSSETAFTLYGRIATDTRSAGAAAVPPEER